MSGNEDVRVGHAIVMLHACANTRGAGKDSCTQHGAP